MINGVENQYPEANQSIQKAKYGLKNLNVINKIPKTLAIKLNNQRIKKIL